MPLAERIMYLVNYREAASVGVQAIKQAQRIEDETEYPGIATQQDTRWRFFDARLRQLSFNVTNKRLIVKLSKIGIVESEKIESIMRKQPKRGIQ